MVFLDMIEERVPSSNVTTDSCQWLCLADITHHIN